MCNCCQNTSFNGSRNGCGGNRRNAGCCQNTGCQNVLQANTGVATQGCGRYISFQTCGTAYVPTSAVYFCPNTFGTAQNGTNGTANTGGGCGCFGRCGGRAAIANYYEDYYARQYGLNN